MQLPAGTYAVQWHSLGSRDTVGADQVTVAGPGAVGFTAPFAAGPAVLHLRRA